MTKSVTIDPGNAFNQYYIAEYFDVVGEKGQAIEHLNALMALSPTTDVDGADLKNMQGRGKKLLGKLQK